MSGRLAGVLLAGLACADLGTAVATMPRAAVAQGPTAAAPLTALADPRGALDACMRRRQGEAARPEADGVAQPLSAVCPELSSFLLHAPWSTVLPQRVAVEAGDADPALAELRALLDASLMRRPDGSIARQAALESILHSLDAPQRPGFWQHVGAALHRLLSTREPGAGGNGAAGWLTRLGLQAGTPEEILRAALGALLIAIAALGARPLRAWVLRARGARRRQRPAETAGVEPAAPETVSTAAAAAALQEEPRLLLERIMAQLCARGQLADAGGLTVRELLGRVRALEGADRERLATLARAAELVRYAPEAPPAQKLRAAIAGGRALLHALSTAVATSGAGR